MGSGKTFLGRELARRINREFYDLDQEVQKKTLRIIENFFINKQEREFRIAESTILCGWTAPGVIATGGGIIELPINRDFLKKNENLVIWLHPAWNTLYNRIKKSSRPLVKDLKREELRELWLRRLPLYRECADIIYSGLTLTGLLELLKKTAL